MTRRRTVIGLAVLVFIMILVGLRKSEVLAPKPMRAYTKIRLGMTLTEVTDAIGEPPGYQNGISRIRGSIQYGETVKDSDDSKDSVSVPDEFYQNSYFKEFKYEFWIWQDYVIGVAFDEKGKAVRYYMLEVKNNSGLFGRLKKVIGL